MSIAKTMKAWRARNMDKVMAYRAVFVAMRAGKLIRCPCAVCGREETEAHHEDYNKPLDVVWLCKAHHEEEHQKVVAPEWTPEYDSPSSSPLDIIIHKLSPASAMAIAQESGETIEDVYTRLVQLEGKGMVKILVRDFRRTGRGFINRWKWLGPKPGQTQAEMKQEGI